MHMAGRRRIPPASPHRCTAVVGAPTPADSAALRPLPTAAHAVGSVRGKNVTLRTTPSASHEAPSPSSRCAAERCRWANAGTKSMSRRPGARHASATTLSPIWRHVVVAPLVALSAQCSDGQAPPALAAAKSRIPYASAGAARPTSRRAATRWYAPVPRRSQKSTWRGVWKKMKTARFQIGRPYVPT